MAGSIEPRKQRPRFKITPKRFNNTPRRLLMAPKEFSQDSKIVQTEIDKETQKGDTKKAQISDEDRIKRVNEWLEAHINFSKMYSKKTIKCITID